MAEKSADQLYALVDMGSNGIRLSITSLAPPTTRILPTVYQSRIGISLYDAQYNETDNKTPIPEATIKDILAALIRFKQTTLDFNVPQLPANIRILATEATRTALNADAFLETIETTLCPPWKLNILRKEDEGRIGALGVVSSVGGSDGIEGLMMDLGGGSTQITWLIARPGSPLQTSPLGSVSFPYGAAAMTRLLAEHSTDTARSTLRTKIISDFRSAYQSLQLPQLLSSKAYHRGLTLYLSGGGFRGWGYLLMSSHRIRPYPIPIINGFSVPVKDFKNTSAVSDLALQSLSDKTSGDLGVFRVSKRRAAQVPAVSFLVDALVEAIDVINEVRFCQGGVREGWLWENCLGEEVKAMDPLVSASSTFAKDEDSSKVFTRLLQDTIPGNCEEMDRVVPGCVTDPNLLKSFANLLFFQQGQSKEVSSVNALCVTITGVLANAHGVGHAERALLALMLCQRWGGSADLPPPYGELKGRLELLLTSQEIWWARYFGVIGWCIGEIYPAGRIREGKERMGMSARWSEGLGKKGNMQGIVLSLKVLAEEVGWELRKEIVEQIEDSGKKKNRVGGKEYGFGVPIRVDVSELK